MDQDDETGRLLAAIGSLVQLADPSYATAVLREAAHSLVAGKGGRVAKGRASPDQVHTWKILRAELHAVVEEKELSVATVAEQLGLSVSTVREMLHRRGGTPSDEARHRVEMWLSQRFAVKSPVAEKGAKRLARDGSPLPDYVLSEGLRAKLVGYTSLADKELRELFGVDRLVLENAAAGRSLAPEIVTRVRQVLMAAPA